MSKSKGFKRSNHSQKRKTIDEFAAENPEDIIVRNEIRENGQFVRTLVCRFCFTTIAARNRRIGEHLKSKRHLKLKLDATMTAGEELHLIPPQQQQYLGETLISKLLPSIIPILADEHTRTEMTTSSNNDNTTTTKTIGQKEKHQQQEKEDPQELLCIKWENFISNFVSMLTKLQSQNHFVDVTLWCEGSTIKCHKLILSAGSKYFEKLFIENPHTYHHHPIIFLKDMRFWEITALVEFLYKGEVKIHKDKLQALIRAAQSLQIKCFCSPGLTQEEEQEEDDGDRDQQHDSGIINDGSPRDGSMDITKVNRNSSEDSQQTQYFQNNNQSVVLEKRKRRRKTSTPKRLNIEPKKEDNLDFGDDASSVDEFINFVNDQLLQHDQ